MKKVVGWAIDKGGKGVVNDIAFADSEFGKSPANDAAAAYLLNCAPDQLEAARSAFRIPSMTTGPDGIPVADMPTGKYNGQVKMLKAAELSGPWSESASATEDRLFYRAILVK